MSKEFEIPCIEVSVLSVQESEFTNKDTGERRKMWRVYAADPTGAVGSVWSTVFGWNLLLTVTVGLQQELPNRLHFCGACV